MISRTARGYRKYHSFQRKTSETVKNSSCSQEKESSLSAINSPKQSFSKFTRAAANSSHFWNIPRHPSSGVIESLQLYNLAAPKMYCMFVFMEGYLKLRLDEYFKEVNEEVLPWILQAILNVKLTGKQEETDSGLLDELQVQESDDVKNRISIRLARI
ncbi:hypothetical protein M9H77_06731 [Catharanthus roseus]|uniref:Uncharacterized protein n=1 Tax=Catharanthus roseus TaxID=4058 RepID=A0ACC0BSX5_CATRO|nr:hypothetical protein M9H77_06731 [Catharanthus roseus]